jgi:serine/threonine protein kinase
LNKKVAEDWFESIKEASSYANLFDYYEFIKDLGQGQFGVVKLGVHKMTGKKVAIKTIKKGNMSATEMDL